MTRPPTPGPIKLTAEAGGFVLACTCRWLRYAATQVLVREYRKEHEKRCAVARMEEAEDAA